MRGPKVQTYIVRVTPLESTEPISLDADRVRSELETGLEGSGYGVGVTKVRTPCAVHVAADGYVRELEPIDD